MWRMEARVHANSRDSATMKNGSLEADECFIRALERSSVLEDADTNGEMERGVRVGGAALPLQLCGPAIAPRPLWELPPCDASA